LLKIHAPIRHARYEDVPLQRLDTLLPDFETLPGPVHLKIDTQGYEKFVILGAGNRLEQTGSVRMEVAVTEVYE
jgi:FkbM family methyltransferase